MMRVNGQESALELGILPPTALLASLGKKTGLVL